MKIHKCTWNELTIIHECMYKNLFIKSLPEN